MKFALKIILLTTFVFSIDYECLSAQRFLYILNDDCLNELSESAENYFKKTQISVIRDSRGIILRLEIKNPAKEYSKFSPEFYTNIISIEHFLAKIKNPAIIEVHTENISSQKDFGIKNWEMSTVIANRIEELMLKMGKECLRGRINSIGYGEFLPSKNTSNNGGAYPNRVDIIILCNISGE